MCTHRRGKKQIGLVVINSQREYGCTASAVHELVQAEKSERTRQTEREALITRIGFGAPVPSHFIRNHKE